MAGDLPTHTQALVLKHDGYSATATGPMLETAEDWLALDDIPLPPIGPDQVLIRVRRASVNPSDIHFIKGEYGQPRVAGAAAGFEGCGDVIAGPPALKGQRVAFVAGPNGSGAWAEYAVADATTCIPLRPEISDDDGAAQIVNPLTARAMMGLAQEAGDAVIITAATSQLGKLMVALAGDMGLTLIATVRRKDAVADLKERGAAHVICTSDTDMDAQIKVAIGACKPRMMLDAVCDPASEQIFVAMPNGARWVCYGKLSTDVPCLSQMGQLIFMNKRIEGFWLTQWMRTTPPADQIAAVRDVQERFADGRWSTDVVATLSLREAMSELPAALRKTDGKTMIAPHREVF